MLQTDRHYVSYYTPSLRSMLQAVTTYHVIDRHYVSCYRPSLRVMLQTVTTCHVTDRHYVSCYRPSQHIMLQTVTTYHVTYRHYVSCYRPSLRIMLQTVTTYHVTDRHYVLWYRPSQHMLQTVTTYHMLSFSNMTQTSIRSYTVYKYHVSVCVVWFNFVISFLPFSPNGVTPGPPHCWGFTITLRHITVGRAPLEEWSARRRDLYLTAERYPYPR
jgi:hypothetical protein